MPDVRRRGGCATVLGAAAVSATTRPAGSPTQLLDEWASCMRGHGDPNQVDPTVDASKVIQITLGYPGGLHAGNGAEKWTQPRGAAHSNGHEEPRLFQPAGSPLLRAYFSVGRSQSNLTKSGLDR